MVEKSKAIQKEINISLLSINENPFELVFRYLPLFSIILSFISDNVYTNTQDTMNHFLYHQLKSENEYHIIRQMKKLFIQMIYSNLYSNLITDSPSDITDNMKRKFPNETTFLELCKNVKVSRTLLFELSNNSSNYFVKIGQIICNQVLQIFYDNVWPYDLIPESRKWSCCDNNRHIKSTTKENIDKWSWYGFEQSIPGCCIILLNFLQLYQDDQLDYFLSKITNINKEFYWWVHINGKKCGSYYCVCKNN